MNIFTIFDRFVFCPLCEAHLHISEYKYTFFGCRTPANARDPYICCRCHSHKKSLEKSIRKNNFRLKKLASEMDDLYYADKDFVEIAFNGRFGGFGLSDEAKIYLKKLALKNGLTAEMVEYLYDHNNLKRHDRFLIQTIRNLGDRANGRFSNLCIKKIPVIFRDFYKIEKFDGVEKVIYDIGTVVAHKIAPFDENISPDDSKIIVLELMKLIEITKNDRNFS
jgi:hypothetical protein